MFGTGLVEITMKFMNIPFMDLKLTVWNVVSPVGFNEPYLI